MDRNPFRNLPVAPSASKEPCRPSNRTSCNNQVATAHCPSRFDVRPAWRIPAQKQQLLVKTLDSQN